MGRMIMHDCAKCGARFDWDVSDDSQLCQRCKTLASDDLTSIIKELKKQRVPGQEPILRMIEVIFQKLSAIETKLSERATKDVSSSDSKQNTQA